MTIPQRRNDRRVTLTDIAQACHLAPSTVSRALHDPGRVNSHTYERIVRAAQELGYHDDFGASSTPSFIRGTVALVVPSLTNPVTLDLIRGCHARVQSLGYLFMLVSTDESSEQEASWISELSGTVDGMILASPRLSDEELRHKGANTPIVVVNRELEGMSSVIADTSSAMKQALRYLASLGHQEIAYVHGPSDSRLDRARYRAVMNEAADLPGVSVKELGPYRPSLVAGEAAADALAISGVTGVMFFDDLLALGAMRRFAHIGMRVPEDISVIGCDDCFAAQMVQPQLTTVSASADELGRSAAQLLVTQLGSANIEPQSQCLPAQLAIRHSTAGAAT
jgi:DNA-binding LacI/PurR family transcriptional regulator